MSLATAAEPVRIDPLFDDAGDADRLVELARRHGRYQAYAEQEQIELEVGPGLMPRHDSVQNFLRRGGVGGSTEPVEVLIRRTSYFREEYAYGGRVITPGVEAFLHHDKLAAAGAAIHDRPVVEPAIAYANLLLAGQELAIHTDVPEFLGLDRKLVPQWLLVVMHHSGLFDPWRLHIATGVAWFGDGTGGEFVYWPADDVELSGPGEHLRAAHNTAAVLDTDSVFHGVARVGHAGAPAPPLVAAAQLWAAGRDGWDLRSDDGAALAHYEADEVRYSVSWKAYCFADEDDRRRWRTGSDALTVDAVLDRLAGDLAEHADAPDLRTSPDLGRRLIDHHIRFPEPAPQAR